MSNPLRGRVLVVDDDVRIVHGVSELLAKYLYYVRTAHTAATARQEIVLDRFDVVVLDWVLPDGDAAELVRTLEKMSPATNIVVYSAHSTSDAECTAASAHHFVRKSHDTTDLLLNAVKRGVREARDRVQSQSAERPPIASEGAYFIDALMDASGSDASALGKHVAFVASSEWLSRELAWRSIDKSTPRNVRVFELNAADYMESNSFGTQLFGRCSIDQSIPALERGLLDCSTPSVCLLRNPDRLPVPYQEQLAKSVSEGRIRRHGSNRDLEIDVRLVLSVKCDPAQDDSLGLLHDSLRDLVHPHVLRVRTLSSLPGNGVYFLRDLVARACKRRATISPAVESLLETIKIDPPWSVFRFMLEDRCPVARDSVLEVEQLGLPFVESSLIKKDENSQRLSTWKETQEASKLVYVCRLLSETKGNVAEAARQSGLGRNAIYEVLRQNGITLRVFRSKRERLPLLEGQRIPGDEG